MQKTIRPTHLLLLTLFVSACATPPPATVSYPAPAPKPPPPVVTAPPPVAAPAPAPAPSAPAVADASANDRALQTAADAYDRGEFASAIRQLTPLVNDGALDAVQLLRALKILAFSQCSTNAVTACRQTFERALKADPNFDLLAAERGHPIWGAQFARARRTVLGK
jgi:hypothetical protein